MKPNSSRIVDSHTARSREDPTIGGSLRGTAMTALAVVFWMALPLAQNGPGVRLATDTTMPVPAVQALPPNTLGPERSAVEPVSVEIVVAQSGEVIYARTVTAGDPVVGRQAADAARRWKFQPASARLGTLAVLTFTYSSNGVSARLHPAAHEPLPAPAVPIAAEPVRAPGLRYGRLIRDVVPDYTREALAEKINGNVELDLVVLPDGSVGEVRIVKPLDPDFGLNREAEIAARYLLLEPCLRNGTPVACHVVYVGTFHVREAFALFAARQRFSLHTTTDGWPRPRAW